jgi:putative ABC transport system substrate-binding protein
MNEKSSLRVQQTCSDNLKSKPYSEPCRRIQNLKWSGIFAIAFALFAALAHAQQPEKIFRIGYLDGSTASGSAVLVDAFRQELSKLGWIEGKNIAIEYRFAEQKNDRLPELAADLVRFKVDLIVVASTQPVLAAKSATTTVPIVMTNAGDPVTAGLVASLARPGGNVTGISSLAPELNTKRLEILKDAVPKLIRFGFLRSSADSISNPQLQELRPAAVALKLKLEEIETQPDRKGLESAFQAAKQKQVDAIMTSAGRRLFAKESRLSSLPANIGCRLFTFRRSLSMRAVSCPTERTTMISIGAQLFMWTRF